MSNSKKKANEYTHSFIQGPRLEGFLFFCIIAVSSVAENLTGLEVLGYSLNCSTFSVETGFALKNTTCLLIFRAVEL